MPHYGLETCRKNRSQVAKDVMGLLLQKCDIEIKVRQHRWIVSGGGVNGTL